eukprot:scaffold176650_cov35-Tisochrysis_lutea.AAC.2
MSRSGITSSSATSSSRCSPCQGGPSDASVLKCIRSGFRSRDGGASASDLPFKPATFVSELGTLLNCSLRVLEALPSLSMTLPPPIRPRPRLSVVTSRGLRAANAARCAFISTSVLVLLRLNQPQSSGPSDAAI